MPRLQINFTDQRSYTPHRRQTGEAPDSSRHLSLAAFNLNPRLNTEEAIEKQMQSFLPLKDPASAGEMLTIDVTVIAEGRKR